MTAAQLAKEVRKWRGEIPARVAAAQLGMSKRTYEGIEQGRGFHFATILIAYIRNNPCQPE